MIAIFIGHFEKRNDMSGLWMENDTEFIRTVWRHQIRSLVVTANIIILFPESFSIVTENEELSRYFSEIFILNDTDSTYLPWENGNFRRIFEIDMKQIPFELFRIKISHSTEKFDLFIGMEFGVQFKHNKAWWNNLFHLEKRYVDCEWCYLQSFWILNSSH